MAAAPAPRFKLRKDGRWKAQIYCPDGVVRWFTSSRLGAVPVVLGLDVGPSRQSLPPGVRFAVLQRCGFACSYCGRKAPDVVLEVDHIVPVIAGGSDDDDNLTAACWDCNSGKSDMVLDG